jgi:hypothetical protein
MAQAQPSSAVETARVPDGGIQPQAAVATDGAIHLLYYKGEPQAGDLFYVRRAQTDVRWSKPLRVNSQPGSAIAAGNDRGGQIALGRNGFVHVAWNGSGTAVPGGPEKSSPMLYSRLLPGTDAFEPQRSLMTASSELDGGGSVAADSNGNVYVVWHGLPVKAPERSEIGRRVFVAASGDDGATFTPEAARSDPSSGVCGCCGLKAAALPSGDVLVLYRAASQSVHRDMRLMHSRDAGRTFSDKMMDAWELNACPMTTAAIVPAGPGAALAWETKEDVRWTLAPDGAKPGPVRFVGDKDDLRKYPALAVDHSGRVLVAWTEGMRWKTAGKLRWSLFDSAGKPVENESGGADGVPVWSLVAAVAKPGGGFLILY